MAHYNYLPGPVTLVDGVLEAAAAEPVSHRDPGFLARFDALRGELCRRVNAPRVQIMTGSGTLANDAVAARLGTLPGRGLVLANGEFGRRLRDHAIRAGLGFDLVEAEEGRTFDREVLEEAIGRRRKPAWLWAVHCETSTGVLNDLPMLRDLCAAHDIRLCLDCISSIGACDVDLAGVHQATAVSGKGIGSLPGLATVFHGEESVSGTQQLPRCLDLSCYVENRGVPFTLSSNAVQALTAALRAELEEMGLAILAEEPHRAPHITTITLPEGVSSLATGELLEKNGILVSHRSGYLIEKNRLQICFMGECREPPPRLFHLLRRIAPEPDP